VEERPKGLAVIVSTDKITIAVTILFTVTFPLYTRGVRTAAVRTTAVDISSTTSWAILWYTRLAHRKLFCICSGQDNWRGRLLAAIIFLMVVSTKLLAVVCATD